MTVSERQVLDALPITVYTVDLDGNITMTNRAWARFAAANGAPQLADTPAVTGTSIWSAIREAGPRARVERAMTLIRNGRAAAVSWEFPCSSPEEERVFLMNVTPVRDGDALAGFAFSTVDITPSHNSREVLLDTGMALARTISVDRVLAEVANQLRRAIHCEAIAIGLADDDTAALHLAYHSGFDEDPTALEQRLVPEWLEALAGADVVVRTIDGRLQLTAPMTSTEGVLGAVLLGTAPIDEPHLLEEARRLLATIAAQTAAAIERAWLVRRVEHKRRLEAVGEVAAGVAHELRNPLFGISSAAQLLRFRVKEDPIVEKNVGRILREVERLNGMITALLEYGRPAQLRPRPGDPDQVWDEVLDAQRGRLESKVLLLQRERAVPPARVALDPEQLAQVFSNILVNAADAAPEASDLTLASQTLPNGAWRMRLHNRGPVIPADVLPRVFELFFSMKTGGTGIGLALCQRIVEEHGGTITIESAPDAGTTLTILLPPVP